MKLATWIPFGCIALGAPALAADTVIHEGDAAAATATVAERARVAPTTLTALTLTEWIAKRPAQISHGTVEDCAGEPADLAALRKHLSAVDDALTAKDFEFILGPARAGEKAALCVTGAIPAADLARIEFAVGVGAAANGDDKGAQAAWQQAVRLDPKASWIAAVPPEMKQGLDIAIAESQKRTVPLTVVPADRITVDGAPGTPAAMQVAPGAHWVRVGDDNLRIQVLAGTAPVLVAPAALAAGATNWVTDPARGQDLFRAAQTLSPAGTLYVVTQDRRVFRRSATGWDELAAPAATVATAKPPTTEAGEQLGGNVDPIDVPGRDQEDGGFNAGAALLPIGGAVTVTGIVLTATALGVGGRAIDQASVPGITDGEYAEAQNSYDSARTQIFIGDALIGAGVVLAGVGGVMLLDGASISPWWIPGGGGLGLTVGGGR